MIIAVKYDYRAYATLCEEVRRTDKRIYVCYVAGDTYVTLMGRRPNTYVDIADVVTETATAEQFTEIKRFVDAHNDEMREMERKIAEVRQGFGDSVRNFIDKQ